MIMYVVTVLEFYVLFDTCKCDVLVRFRCVKCINEFMYFTVSNYLRMSVLSFESMVCLCCVMLYQWTDLFYNYVVSWNVVCGV